MKKVTIYKMKTPSMESIPVVEVRLSDTGEVTFTGDEIIIGNLKKSGVSNQSGDKDLLPADGIEFLEALQYVFKTPYLSATEVIEA
jgi:hypothetical protein